MDKSNPMISKPHAICINGRFLSHPVTGVQRYARELLWKFDAFSASIAHSKNPQIEVLVPANVARIPLYKRLHVRKIGFLSGHLWEQLELPFYCRGKLLFTPGAAAPLLHRWNAVTMHDTAVFSAPAGYSLCYRMWYRMLGRLLGRTAIQVFTVSEFSKHEIVKWTGASSNKIMVTHLGSEHIRRVQEDVSIITKHGLKSGKFILAVGVENSNKNVYGILRAIDLLKQPDIPLVIAGGRNQDVFGTAVPISQSVKQVGYVSDAELRALYEHAACLAFPSFYEGFGLPPLEAIACGCPIVVSTKGSLPEIFSGSALFTDAGNPSDIAEKLQCALDGRAPGRKYLMECASAYSWSKCAEQTWNALLRCIE
jgi:glycosyltransferase involved in cell wall biosynthesis